MFIAIDATSFPTASIRRSSKPVIRPPSKLTRIDRLDSSGLVIDGPSTLENPPVQHQQIHSIGSQRDQGLLRRVYDRLFVDVEAGVDERGNAAAGMPSFQNAAIERSRLGIDDLRPRRSVDVDDGGNAVAPRRSA